MLNTYRAQGRAKYGKAVASAANVANGASLLPPVGGWDAINPISAMPPQNAVELVNWFPQPGYVELRRGHLIHSDTGTGEPVETVMEYQSQDSADNGLFAASDGEIFNVTTSTASSVGSMFTNDRWQYVNVTTSGGSFLWMCNGSDTPQYWDGSALAALTITGVTPEDMIHVAVYRSRIWTVLKDSTKAAYLDVDSIQGAATEFDVGIYFRQGGYLQAIGTWSTDTNDGPNEFIAFISSFGDIVLFQIEDPDDPTKVQFLGTSQVGTPIGRRCLAKIGSDLGLITIDGVLPISQILTYDRAALIGKSITVNIRQAMTQAARDYKNNFGWQLISYPRSTMAILNVPVSENDGQQQYVMNTITGAWGQFEGQYANCWAVFEDRAYFGDNDGVVRIADESGGDENQTLSADMRTAFNYYQTRGLLKRWTMVRPSITIDAAFPVQPYMGINVDFGTTAPLSPIFFGNGITIPLWDVALWDVAVWPGNLSDNDWVSVGGMGYCASIRMTVDIPWSENVRSARDLRINGFDVLSARGAYV